MPKFIKLAETVEAHRWFKNGDHPGDYAKDREGFKDGEPGVHVYTADFCREHQWEGEVVRYFRRPDVKGTDICHRLGCGRTMHDHGWIDQGGEGDVVCPGKWVVGDHPPYLVLSHGTMMAGYEQVSGLKTPAKEAVGYKEFGVKSPQVARARVALCALTADERMEAFAPWCHECGESRPHVCRELPQ